MAPTDRVASGTEETGTSQTWKHFDQVGVGDIRFSPTGEARTVADQLRAPVNDILWHQGKLYISHFQTISVLESEGTQPSGHPPNLSPTPPVAVD
jgi:hypothetical protein